MSTTTDFLILQNLLHREDYTAKVIIHITEDLFHDKSYSTIFKIIKDYYSKYKTIPTYDSMIVEIDELSLNENMYEEINSVIDDLKDKPEDSSIEWLLDTTEKWCQDKSIHNAIMLSIDILDENNKKFNKISIPEILREALSKTFDSRIGHDYFENVKERFDYYNEKLHKIPTDIDYFNKITDGGSHRKTINVLMAGTNVGKTLGLCHLATSYIRDGYNVLYITLEMREEEIAKRIDSNLLDISLNEIGKEPRDIWNKRMDKIRKKVPGNLIIREYPMSTAGAAHFRYLIDELHIKKKFKPDVIMVDYLNICTSVRYKSNDAGKKHDVIQSISEELRGLATEKNVIMWTATQVNRTGFTKSDIGLNDIADSFSSTFGVDLLLGLMSNDDLAKLNQIMVFQLKNRMGDKRKFGKFVIGIDYDKQRLYNVENNAQLDSEDSPIMDNTQFGQREKKFKDGGWE